LAVAQEGAPELALVPDPPVIALLSNKGASGNMSRLPAIRTLVGRHSNIIHCETKGVSDIPAALRSIARMKPVVLAINGGDGTVQKVLTELHRTDYFIDPIPPVAVLPNGKTNLIAQDLGAGRDPLAALELLVRITDSGVDRRLVSRHLIALNDGTTAPVLGMFLGGEGLAEAILYCREKVYPLGLSNRLSHLITFIIVFLGIVLRVSTKWRPHEHRRMTLSGLPNSNIDGRFLMLMVTTLEHLLLNLKSPVGKPETMKLMAIERGASAFMRSILAMMFGRLGQAPVRGVHLHSGTELRIEGKRLSVILDGEAYKAAPGASIVLTATSPMRFVSLTA
jgi:hypothetical protein